jgi:hypothetical protein
VGAYRRLSGSRGVAEVDSNHHPGRRCSVQLAARSQCFIACKNDAYACRDSRLKHSQARSEALQKDGMTPLRAKESGKLQPNDNLRSSSFDLRAIVWFEYMQIDPSRKHTYSCVLTLGGAYIDAARCSSLKISTNQDNFSRVCCRRTPRRTFMNVSICGI